MGGVENLHSLWQFDRNCIQILSHDFQSQVLGEEIVDSLAFTGAEIVCHIREVNVPHLVGGADSTIDALNEWKSDVGEAASPIGS